MTAHLTFGATMALMTFTAVGYALATVGMKFASAHLTPLAISLMAAGLVCAAMAEIILLRHSNMAVIYLGIIAFESLLVLTFATLIGETLGPKQITGAALVLFGMVLVSH